MELVDSTQFAQLPAHERFYRLAIAYLSAANIQNKQQMQSATLAWEHASVVYFCTIHAIELFLKACILVRSSKGEQLHHKIGKLKQRYIELYPDSKYEFTTPWDLDINDIERIAGISVPEGVHRQPDQTHRYFSDKNGNAPASTCFYAPATMDTLIFDFSNSWKNIWPIVLGNEVLKD